MILTQEPGGSPWRWHAPAGFVAREDEPSWRNDSQLEYPYNECQQQQKMQAMDEMRHKKSKQMMKRKRKKKESTCTLEKAWFYVCVATLTPENEPTTFRRNQGKNNNGKESNYKRPP